MDEHTEKGPYFYVEADDLRVDGRNKTLYANGNVNVSREDVILEAEEVMVDLTRETSSAIGDVRLCRDRDILKCRRMEYHWIDQTGWIENGHLYIGETGYTIEGDILEKTGPDTYALEQGSFTTCDCPPRSRIPWRIGARKSEVTLGGYARVEDAKFFLYEIPILYLPVGYIPVKLHRETGFLVPRVGESGSHGFEIGLPFYWAINASMDATLTFQGLTKRGFKPTMEFRYTPSKKTSGEMHISGIQDEKTDTFRYGLKATHQQQISSTMYDKLDLNIVGDKQYIVDFAEELAHPSDRFVESRGIVGVRKDNLHATAQISYFNLVADMGAKQVPQRLPHLHMDFLRSPVLSHWISFGFGSSFMNFVNEEESERTRMDLFPRLFLFFPVLEDVGVEGEIGFRETFDWEDWEGMVSEGIQHREIWRAAMKTEFPFWRRFRWGSYRLSHILRPGLQYQYVDLISGDDLPIFDGIDAYLNRNILTYSLANTLIGGNEDREKGVPASTFLECTLKQSLDFQRLRNLDVGESFSDILMFLTLNPRDYLSLHIDLGWDPHGKQIRSIHGSAGYADRKERYRLQLGYVSVQSQTIDSITRVELLEDYDMNYFFPGVGKALQSFIEVRVFERMKGSLQTYYQLEESGKVENRLELEYLSRCRCWSAFFILRQTIRPDDVGFAIRFQLEGLGS